MGKSGKRWHELCERVAVDDNLPVRLVRFWTIDKLYFWNRYIEITTTAMVGHPQWAAGLIYVDLFAGPGICRSKETQERLPGSPLIAANAPKPFRRILLIEKDSKSAAACEQRLREFDADERSRVFTGDCNKLIHELVTHIPDGALTIAFIDPTGLHAEFETIRVLSSRGRVDLLILFADALDIVRNVETYSRQPNSKLDRFLGPDCNWRDRWLRLNSHDSSTVRTFFADIYTEQLQRHLGYRRFGDQVISMKSQPIYRLVYASKHDRGLDFWEKAKGRDRRGQQELF